MLSHLQKERQFPTSRVGTVDELCLHFASVAERRPGNCALRHAGMRGAFHTFCQRGRAPPRQLCPQTRRYALCRELFNTLPACMKSGMREAFYTVHLAAQRSAGLATASSDTQVCEELFVLFASLAERRPGNCVLRNAGIRGAFPSFGQLNL